jgi:hypothetical protein
VENCCGRPDDHNAIQVTPGDLEVGIGVSRVSVGSSRHHVHVPGSAPHQFHHRGKTPYDVVVMALE